jgi:hypothetical protein
MVSLMNGLSAAGQGISSFAGAAGLEQIKSDLADRQAVLADSLASARETAGRTQAGGIAAAAAGVQQAATAAAATQQQAATSADVATQQTGANTRTATEQEGANRRNAETVNAPPDVIKILKALGAMPDAAPPNATPNGGSFEPQGAAAGVGTGPTPSSTVANPPSDLSNNPIVAKALGLGAPGSDAANRQAIAQDVNADPKFKGATVGQKAAEIENRFAVATAKMASPEDRHVMAAGIANYSLSPLDARARMMAGGPETMSEALSINPKYSETNYDAIKETQKAIAPGGSLSVPISAMNTSLGHAAHFLDLATQLGNYSGGNWNNIIPNKIAQSTGHQPLVNALDQTAFAMAEEGNRIYAGNAGTESAIDHWYKTFPTNGSLADQVGAVKNFAQLMGDKFDTMTSQVNKQFSQSGLPPVELLLPKAADTFQRLVNMGGDGKPAQPPIPSWVKPGDQYSPSRGQARGADGTSYGPP